MANKDQINTGEIDEAIVRQTSDYSIFKRMHGNREVDKKHVRELVRLFQENGNRTAEFPIIVDSRMNVIDGQHRLAALEELGWTVGYRQLQSTGIELVRAINAGNKRWNWADISISYAELGNKEYEWFYQFAKAYDLSYSMAIAFAVNRVSGHRRSIFSQGKLVVEDKERAVRSAEMYQDVLEFIGTSRPMGIGWFIISRGAVYNHERMVRKFKETQSIPVEVSSTNAARSFEAIYNRGYSEESHVRLF